MHAKKTIAVVILGVIAVGTIGMVLDYPRSPRAADQDVSSEMTASARPAETVAATKPSTTLPSQDAKADLESYEILKSMAAQWEKP